MQLRNVALNHKCYPTMPRDAIQLPKASISHLQPNGISKLGWIYVCEVEKWRKIWSNDRKKRDSSNRRHHMKPFIVDMVKAQIASAIRKSVLEMPEGESKSSEVTGKLSGRFSAEFTAEKRTPRSWTKRGQWNKWWAADWIIVESEEK